MASGTPPAFFTVDVEDWTADFPDLSAPTRLAEPLSRLLDLLARHGTRATLFLLVGPARQHAELVRQAVRQGHRIGLHGLDHRLVYESTPEHFLRDVRDGRRQLEDLTGVQVTSYRAPCWSFTRQTKWAPDALVEAGFEVDSSIFPTKNHVYGIPDAPIDPYWLRRGLAEFPPSVLKVAGRNIPFGGGFYLRASPLWLTRLLARRATSAGRAVMVYVHPWEVDEDQPRDLPYTSRLGRAIHYLNLRGTYDKVDLLLRDLGPFEPLPQTAAEAARFIG